MFQLWSRQTHVWSFIKIWLEMWTLEWWQWHDGRTDGLTVRRTDCMTDGRTERNHILICPPKLRLGLGTWLIHLFSYFVWHYRWRRGKWTYSDLRCSQWVNLSTVIMHDVTYLPTRIGAVHFPPPGWCNGLASLVFRTSYPRSPEPGWNLNFSWGRCLRLHLLLTVSIWKNKTIHTLNNILFPKIATKDNLGTLPTRNNIQIVFLSCRLENMLFFQ